MCGEGKNGSWPHSYDLHSKHSQCFEVKLQQTQGQVQIYNSSLMESIRKVIIGL